MNIGLVHYISPLITIESAIVNLFVLLSIMHVVGWRHCVCDWYALHWWHNLVAGKTRIWGQFIVGGIIKGAKKFLWLSYFNQVRFDLNVTDIWWRDVVLIILLRDYLVLFIQKHLFAVNFFILNKSWFIFIL